MSRTVNVYKRTGPAFRGLECHHEALCVVNDREGKWRGLYCEHCNLFWYMSDISKGLNLLELERENAPD